MKYDRATRNGSIGIMLLLLAAGAFIYGSIVGGRNNVLSEKLKEALLTGEVLLSEKLAAEKELNHQRTKLGELDGKYRGLTTQHRQTADRLADTELALMRSQGKRGAEARLIRENQALVAEKHLLEKALASAREGEEAAQQRGDTMAQSLALLQAQNRELQQALDAPGKGFDEVLAVTSSRKRKLTVQSRRVRQLEVMMDVATTARDLTFRILAPDGSELPVTEKDLPVRVINDGSETTPQAFYVSAARSAAGHNKRVALQYHPAQKLRPGVYTVQVYDDLMSIGSLQVKLK